jgi:hypothetical protein
MTVKTRSWFLILIMSALAGVGAQAQIAMGGQRPAPSPAVVGGDSERGGPVLTGDANNPVLRYPVAHQHAMSACMGYLYISKDRIKFDSQTEAVHSFDQARSDITVAQQWHLVKQEAEIRFRNNTVYHFFHVKQHVVTNASMRFGWPDVLSEQDLINGAMRFDEVVAGLRAQQHVAAPPVISMIEPADAAVEGKTLMATGGNMRLRGIVSQESGIASVLVNGQPAALRQLTPQTHEFVAENVSVGNGTSAIVVLVMATDKSEAHKTFTVSRQGVRILEPAYFPYETGESTVRVRGVAAGYSNVQRVEISGTPAVLTRQNGSDIEFQSEAALNVGDNNLQGYVVDSSGAREPFSLAVKRLPPAGPQPLKEQEVEKALEDGLPSNRIMALVNKYGVDFALTDEVEQRLRRAGADSNLLLAIAKAKK